jgi:type I restriction enzyme S subunit
MELRAEYKQTVVGAIPKDWDVKKIKEISDVKGGKRLPLGRILSDQETLHPYIRVADMFFGGISLENIKYVPDDVFPFVKNYCISSNDIFISVTGATLGTVGRVPQELDGANLTENADKLTNIQCVRDFLLYNMMSERIQRYIESEKTVGAQPKLALIRIKNFEIAIPPRSDEQRSIAAALSDVDALIAALDRLIAKKRNIKHAAMQELLTGKRRLPGFARGNGYKQTEVGLIPKDWNIAKLGDCAFVTKLAGFEYTLHFDYSKNGPIIAIRALNIRNGTLDLRDIHTIPKRTSDLLPRSKLVKGDLVISYVGTLGKVAIIQEDEKFHLAPNVAKISVERASVSPEFLCHYLNGFGGQKRIFEAAASTTQAALSMHNLRDILIIKPPIGEQNAIAALLSDMEAEIATLAQKGDKIHELKQGMMQELLTGRIRLMQGGAA